MKQEYSAVGFQKPAEIATPRSPVSYEVIVPDGVDVEFSVLSTLGERKDENRYWHTDIEGETGTVLGSFGDPVSALAIDIKRISGGPIFFTVLQNQ